MKNKQLYIQFAGQADELPIFFQPWYLDTVCGAGQWDAIVEKRAGKVVAVWPYFLKQKGPFKYITMPELCKMMGPFIIPEFQNQKQGLKLLKAMLDQLPEVDYYYQQLLYSNQNWLPFYWKDYQQSTAYSYIIEPLSPLDKVFERFATDYRNNKISKANELVTVVDDRSAAEFFRVNKKSFDRQQISLPFTEQFFLQFDKVLAVHHSRKMFFAVDADGNVHSVLYLIWDKHAAYNLIAGDDPNFRSSGAGILLVWEAIQFAQKELGLNRFDFLGSMIQPIERVRRQFGAEQQAYFKIWKYNSRVFKWLEKMKGWY